MQTDRKLFLTLATLIAVLTQAMTTACDDDSSSPTFPIATPPVEVGVILNSTDVSITVFAVDSPNITRTIGLNPGGAGSPVTAAVRGNLAAVPLGFFPAVAVVELTTDSVWSIPLPANSGASGIAFLNDSIAYVGNPNLNSVSIVNVFAGTAGAQIAVSVYPQALVTSGDRVFVLNAELDSMFQPAQEGRISVIDATSNTVTTTIVLSGFNPAAGVISSDGLLYVINSGSFGQGNGSLSVVDLATLQEVEHHTGFGEFPRGIAVGPANRVFVSAFAYGIAIWNTATDAFVNSPNDPLVVQGNTTSSGIGFDSSNRLYTLIPGSCLSPSIAYRLNDDLTDDTDIETGGCPFAIKFGLLP